MGNCGYKVKQYGCHLKQSCQIIFIKDNQDLTFIYRKGPNKEKTWPQIRGGVPLYTDKYI